MALVLVVLFAAGCKRRGAPSASSPTSTTPATAEPVAPATPPDLSGAKSVDDFVFGWLKHLGVEPAALCSDEVFVRRVFLDVIGTLPTAAEARTFIASSAPDKRRALVEQLLAREEFADRWAMKWGDLLRIKAEFPVNLWPNAAQAYHRWVRTSVAQNKPYDQFARELLTASGSNFRVGPVNFYRAMQNRTSEGIASTVALTFLGARTDNWPPERLAGLAACFAQIGYKPTREWKEEIVFWDPDKRPVGAPTNAPAAPPRVAVLPDGTRLDLPPGRDPRDLFADWLISPKNPWFNRAIANRVWSWLLHRGIVHEPDDLRDDNPPSNPELLTFLERELVANRYDLKHLFRLILNSRTYQLSARAPTPGPRAAAHFASYPLRRLEAELLLDALNKVTGTSDLYTSAIPEPFTYIPKDTPAMALADGSITSPFLALFGRSARATGQEGERSNRMLPTQRLHLLNSSHIQRKLEQGPGLRAVFEAKQSEDEMLDTLYLTVLSRRPTAAERDIARAYSAPLGDAPAAKAGAGKRREDWLDLAWVLVNSEEFLYRH